MKINNITATDYQLQDGLLRLDGLTGATLEEIAAIDGLVTVQTDDGDLVEAFAGYAMRSITYDLTTASYTAVLALATEDTTAATLTQLAGELAEAQGKVTALEEANTALAGQLAELTGAIERGLTV